MVENFAPNAKTPLAFPTEGIHITACVNQAGRGRLVIQHAHALANALHAPLTILQVLESERTALQPDPIEWDMRRHAARQSLDRLAGPPGALASRPKVRLSEGKVTKEISRFLTDQGENLLVVGMQPFSGRSRRIGRTLDDLLHNVSAPILLVPVSSTGNPAALPVYRRIMVPLDGSTWAASVVPMATRLAKAAGAELILAHVIPTPELTEIGPYDAADLELRERVLNRNRRVAYHYLERLRCNISDLGLNVKVICTPGDDARQTLAMLIISEAVDLMILSARGHGMCANAEMPYGSIAGYLMTHSPVPLLMIRPEVVGMQHETEQQTAELRLPLIASA